MAVIHRKYVHDMGKLVIAMTTDIRFTRPLYTAAEAARYVGMAPSTFRSWASGYETNSSNDKDPVITQLRSGDLEQSIPFIGLVEATVIQAFRRTGLPLQRIRTALEVLSQEGDLEHALASNKLYSDGANVLLDHAGDNDPTRLLVNVVDGQGVFHDLILDYLRKIEFGDTWAQALILPVTADPLLRVQPSKGMGEPLFIKGGAPLSIVTSRLSAGEPPKSVARDFDMDVDDVKEAARVFAPQTIAA